MTEKRFTLKHINEQHLSANLYDGKTFIGSIGIGAELIVGLLNEMSTENRQLKQENEQLKAKNDGLEKDLQETMNIFKEFEKENEQLKQSINQLKIQNSRFMQEVAEYSRKSKELEKENEQLKKENEWLKSIHFANDVLKENEQLKEALKNSYMNEICENCKYGNYFLSDNFDGGFEGDFECLKKHFGNGHWECDGLTECDEFELEIKGDVE